MAASWRHLARLASTRCSLRAHRIIQSSVESRGDSMNCAVNLPLFHRSASTDTATTGETVREPGLLRRFWTWMGTDKQEEVMSEEEATERHALLQRVQDMYFAKPPVTPDLEFYKEVFTTLMKYNDGLGIETLWNNMTEMQVEPDDELRAKIEPFLEDFKRRSWYE